MAEYIERSDITDALLNNTSLEGYDLEEAVNAICAIPVADVRPVAKGAWHGSGDGYADGHLVFDEWECPFCGKYFPEWDEKPDWNFCPNCGADMREES